MRHLLLLCLALASVCAVADTYRWVDPAGRTVVSDSPPPGRTHSVAKTGADSENPDSLPYAAKKAAQDFPVTLFTAADCFSQCKDARELLNKRGVPFTEKMMLKQEDLEELKQLVGDAYVPVLKVGKQSFRGFEAGAYANLLDLAGYPKTAPYGIRPSGGLAK